MSQAPVGAQPVAVDAMGGDHAPEAIVEGAIAAARGGVPVILVGDEARIRPMLPLGVRVNVEHAPDAIGMAESAGSVRRRPEASVRKAMRVVAEQRAGSVVSFGNSGATLVASILDLGVIKGVERPAIATVLPRADGSQLVILDVGANVDCRSELLASFAVLGVAHAEFLGMSAPRVGLLSNGEEPGKGNDQVRAAFPLIEALPIDFVGNVEPSHAFAGGCDVLVCDGFVGNVMLKSMEGAAETVMSMLKEEVRKHLSAQLGAWMLNRALRGFRERIAWEAHGGGLLLGTRGVVVVGHGRATPAAVRAGVELAGRAANQGLVEGIERGLSRRTLP